MNEKFIITDYAIEFTSQKEIMGNNPLAK